MLLALATSTALYFARQASSELPIVLTRKYVAGQKIAYRMTGLNEDPEAKRHYTARIEGVVRQDPTGFFYEDLGWTETAWGKQVTRFLPDDSNAKQTLSLDPKAPFKMPNLSRVSSDLIGPITDLMNFYVDLLIPIRIGAFKKAGDHVYVPFGRPSSWADGNRIKVGYDLIDFDITLRSVNRAKDQAIVVVKHVPPKASKATYPADWMKDSGHKTPTNWLEISRKTNGKWKAAFGKETFDVVIAMSLSTGEIRKADLENVVEVTERECDDESLANPGPPIKYRIHRRISLQPEP